MAHTSGGRGEGFEIRKENFSRKKEKIQLSLRYSSSFFHRVRSTNPRVHKGTGI